jgi:hypothetical protein
LQNDGHCKLAHISLCSMAINVFACFIILFVVFCTLIVATCHVGRSTTSIEIFRHQAQQHFSRNLCHPESTRPSDADSAVYRRMARSMPDRHSLRRRDLNIPCWATVVVVVLASIIVFTFVTCGMDCIESRYGRGRGGARRWYAR